METVRVTPVDSGAFSESFDTFYQREVRSVTGLGFVLSGSKTVAEDLAQEAFLAAYRNWDRISGYDDPGGWVRRVVANRSVSVFRRRATETKVLLRLSPPGKEHLEIPAESAHIWEAVRQLPKRQAQVVALRYLDGRGIKQIADILECSENTVKTHLLRAKKTLARRLEEEKNQ